MWAVLGPKGFENIPKNNCLDHLGGIGSEIMAKIISKLTI